jgi:alpha-ketoglutarate-dependent taurine dioxygenase
MNSFLKTIIPPNEVVLEIHRFLKTDFKDEQLFLNATLKSDLPLSTDWLLNTEEKLKQSRALIIKMPPKENIIEHVKTHHSTVIILGQILGRLMIQNDQGQKIIAVYDRDRHGSMNQGSRYHQTREGGTLHTDNVNVPEIWHYLFLSCISPAFVGGESILVDGIKIHSILKKEYPEVLKTLENNYVWEMRGVSDALYEAPIITYKKDGSVKFRHLRPYMESAHQKAEKPMTLEQLFAIDVLDALTNSTENQARFRLEAGDICLSIDDQVLHGRTCFSDAINAIDVEQFDGSNAQILKRTMERLWIQKQ